MFHSYFKRSRFIYWMFLIRLFFAGDIHQGDKCEHDGDPDEYKHDWMNEWMSERMTIIVSFEVPRCSRETRSEWSWFLQRKERTEVTDTGMDRAPGRRGHRPQGRGPKDADDDDPLRNNRVNVHGSPTVNGNHFKRSRPQCVYLANVKFTRGKGKPESICHGISLSCFCIGKYKSDSVERRMRRGSCCKLLTFRAWKPENVRNPPADRRSEIEVIRWMFCVMNHTKHTERRIFFIINLQNKFFCAIIIWLEICN